MTIYFVLGIAGLLAYHLSKLTGAAGDTVPLNQLLPYFRDRAVNIILTVIVFVGLFVAAWYGELTILGFAGGAAAKGGYFLLGYMSQSVMNHWVKAKEKEIEKPNP
jgi:hypothetical protein